MSILEELREKFVSVASISDAMDRLGIRGIITGIRPMWQGARAVGPAVTVRFGIRMPSRQMPPPKLPSLDDVIEQANVGDVILIEMGGDTDTVVGGNVAARCKKKGISAFVIDGVARDLDEISEMKQPVYVRGLSPRVSRLEIESVNEPINMCNVLIRPGDIIVADDDGIASIPKDKVKDVIDLARKKEEVDRLTKIYVAEGQEIHPAMQRARKEAGWT